MGQYEDRMQNYQANAAQRGVAPALTQIALLAAASGMGVAAFQRLLRLNKEQMGQSSLGSTVYPVRIYSELEDDGKNKKKVAYVNPITILSEGLSGTNASSPAHFPWFWPAAAVTAGGVGIGAYKLTDDLLQSLKVRASKARIEKAKKDYLEALSPPPPEGNKTSSSRTKLAREFDRLFEVFDRHDYKVAFSKGDASRLTGLLAGIYLAAATGGLGFGLYAGYKGHNSASETKALERANMERLNQQQAYTPTPLSVQLPDAT